jgi:hypothetical protein
MAMTPSWTFPTLSFRYDQPISPVTTWFPTVINYQGDASVERKVTEEVASFGKQLGIISEALLEVAGDARHGPKLKRLRTTVDEIEEVKRRQYKIAGTPDHSLLRGAGRKRPCRSARPHRRAARGGQGGGAAKGQKQQGLTLAI